MVKGDGWRWGVENYEVFFIILFGFCLYVFCSLFLRKEEVIFEFCVISIFGNKFLDFFI